jgi:small redox-active disulfide protein 2
MVIKILGKGCKNCATLEETAKKAANELGLTYEIIKVTDINDIADYGVMRTPALVVDEALLLQGRLPDLDEVKALLSQIK